MYSSSNQKINLALAKSTSAQYQMYFQIPNWKFQFSILLVKGKEHQNSAA